jgi:hypothetical protein
LRWSVERGRESLAKSGAGRLLPAIFESPGFVDFHQSGCRAVWLCHARAAGIDGAEVIDLASVQNLKDPLREQVARRGAAIKVVTGTYFKNRLLKFEIEEQKEYEFGCSESY